MNTATNAGDTVWVSNGVYVLANQILITNGIVLRSTNGPDVTIINGGFTAGSATTNNRGLLMSNASAFVSGFTISNGAVLDESGGGVRMYGGGILSNCYVRNNTVFVSAAGTIGGGGIFGYTVVGCQVINNVVSNFNTDPCYGSGGGIYAYTLISNCIVNSNTVFKGKTTGSLIAKGGGIIMSGGTIVSSIIAGNRMENGLVGGVYINGTMNGCTVTVNYAKSTTGGIELRNGKITNCVVSYNQGASIGGIYLTPTADNYTPRVFNTTITGNTNGGVYFGASAGHDGALQSLTDCVIEDNGTYGIYMATGTNNYIFNCAVRRNQGYGVRCKYAGYIRNCLIVGNTNSGTGGGLWLESTCTKALASCCTMASNWSAGAAGSGIRIDATDAAAISSCIIYSNGATGADDVYDACAPTNYGALQYSCIGSNPGFTGAGIIVANPQFKDFAGGNFRLSGSSPCINAGSNELSWMTNSYDLGGQTRIRYGTVDMGAYEVLLQGTIFKSH